MKCDLFFLLQNNITFCPVLALFFILLKQVIVIVILICTLFLSKKINLISVIINIM